MTLLDTDFRVVLEGNYLGQDWASVFYYRKNAPHTTGDAQRLAQAVNGQLCAVLADAMVTQCTMTLITAINLVDLGDFYAMAPTNNAGTIVSSSLGAQWMAMSFRYDRITRLSKNGYKRFPGVDEVGFNHDGSAMTTSQGAAISLLEATLEGELTDGGSIFNPMIPHSHNVTTPPAKPIYVLDTLFGISGVTYTGLTTQNSRKPR